MTQHVMLDLETMGNGNDAAIVSIGAVKFDTDHILDEFHVGVELASAMQFGGKADPGTVEWWLHPDRAQARDNLLALVKIDLPSALQGFSQWFGEDKPIWGNGATFDNVILRSAYARAGMEYPARFWNDRCYRTVKNAYPEITLVREGVHHDACDDARCQAKHLQAIWASLRNRDTLLGEAGRQFRFYEQQHRNKQTPDGDKKAEINADLAFRIEEALR
jgi:hypothetical protein